MPDIEVETEQGYETVTIEFYCNSCGRGICGNYHSGKTNLRKQAYFDADPCSCLTDRIEELEGEVHTLEDKIDDLEMELSH